MVPVISSKKNSFQVMLIGVSSCIAGLGTMPYGFRFAAVADQYSHLLFLMLGSIFAVTALLANAALGTYSLLNAHLKSDVINPYFLAAGSFMSAVPYGFITYFGYETSLPLLINLLMSFTVVIVNTGISYTAIYNFLANASDKKTVKKMPLSFHFISKTAFLVGLLVSLTLYSATVHGLTYVLGLVVENNKIAFTIACIAGIFSWIPFAALYSDSSKTTGEKIYAFMVKKSKKIIIENKLELIILIIALGSGASFCQIAIDFFDTGKDIPEFFKSGMMQTFIYNFIVPCTFFSSAAVNYLALKKLCQNWLR